ncbi:MULTISPECIES: PilZ domain-containing protein [Gammaproteobacteria]|jgi:c-di-GMP-binding flagellar brake protein YcgR|uniref:PilZ domain-containing protein n=1 Tax=Vreelandella halophila TaxID=86177 RepID=A0A9X5B6C4_9GAMM|nr:MULTISPECIES: PilZ domain-containing protein [Gammaproteobacteria]KAA8982001.1 PilZ domain-containing protein [Halospina sp. K52047b]MYL27374.1 PilZ domain-containing protein [Halomonas utahensis]MYL74500.1 PilZ domain-containing protein [Halomonas sp. 22501_18_FS]
MPEQRRYIRTSMSVRIMVRHSEIGEHVFTMRDLSDGGIFVLVDNEPFPGIGSEVEVQVQGLPVPAPVRRMRVVREASDGYGLAFMDTQTEQGEGH